MADSIYRQSFPHAAIHLTLWGLTRTLMDTLLWALGNSNPVSRKQEILRLFKGQSQVTVPQVLFQVLWGLDAPYSTGMSLFCPPQSPDESRLCSILPSGGHSLASPESSARGESRASSSRGSPPRGPQSITSPDEGNRGRAGRTELPGYICPAHASEDQG